jgi:hypothetical protein
LRDRIIVIISDKREVGLPNKREQAAEDRLRLCGTVYIAANPPFTHKSLKQRQLAHHCSKHQSTMADITILNTLFQGFCTISSAIYEYLKIDTTAYNPVMLLVTLLVFACQYSWEYLWPQVEAYLMCTADIRLDDELHNMFMAVSDYLLPKLLKSRSSNPRIV